MLKNLRYGRNYSYRLFKFPKKDSHSQQVLNYVLKSFIQAHVDNSIERYNRDFQDNLLVVCILELLDNNFRELICVIAWLLPNSKKKKIKNKDSKTKKS